MYHLCLFVEPGGRRLVLLKLKIGNLVFPVVFVQGFEGYVQIVMVSVGTGIQINGVGDNFAAGGRRNYQFD
jgi:hypothetical protein